jgi:hypothetical protein
MQSYVINIRKLYLKKLMLIVCTLIWKQNLLFINQIIIWHLFIKSICLRRRCIFIKQCWLLVELVIILLNSWECLFESAIIKCHYLWISFKLIKMIIYIWTLWWYFFCWYNISYELFCFQPILNLIVWIAICMIIA